MPTYNRPISVRYSIESILEQTFPGWTLYITGDCCNEESEKVIMEYKKTYPEKIIWHNFEKRYGGGHGTHLSGDSGAAGRNHGFHSSEEPYIAYLDDDNTYTKNHIQILYDEIKTGKYDFVYSKGVYFNYPKMGKRVVFSDPPARCHIGTDSLMHTRKIAEKIILPTGNLWKPAKDSYRGCHDWDMINRMMNTGATWKAIDETTYTVYWGFTQKDFKDMFWLSEKDNIARIKNEYFNCFKYFKYGSLNHH